MEKEIEFNGNLYHLVSSGRYFIRYSKTNKGRVGAKGLHVDVWEYFSGKKVPDGHEIHHKDFNSLNNDYSNLECLTIKDHRKIHAQYINKPTDFLAQDKAREWHKSESGKEWHRNHAKNSILKIEAKEVKCEECLIVYKTKRPEVGKFCSTKCRQRYYKKKGIGFVDKNCLLCGSLFKAKKRSTKEAVCCSRKCSTRFLLENKGLMVNNKTGRFEKSRIDDEISRNSKN